MVRLSIRVPLWANRLVAVRPVAYETNHTRGENLSVLYNLFYNRFSFSRGLLTSFCSEQVAEAQKLHTVMEWVEPDSTIDIEMNTIEPMTCAPMAGLELLYE